VRSTPKAYVRALALSALFAALIVPQVRAQAVKQTGAADPTTSVRGTADGRRSKVMLAVAAETRTVSVAEA